MVVRTTSAAEAWSANEAAIRAAMPGITPTHALLEELIGFLLLRRLRSPAVPCDACVAPSLARARAGSRRGGGNCRRCGQDLRLHEDAVVDLRIDLDLLDRHLARGFHPLHGGLEHIRNHQAVHRAVITVIDLDAMQPAIEPARLALELYLEDGLRIDPVVAHRAVLEGELELVSIVAFDGLDP